MYLIKILIIKAPVRLKSNVKLIGSGTETILKRIDGYHSGSQKAAVFISKSFPPPTEKNNKMSGHKLGNIIYGK
jgi:hypothetical protein